ncbi:MAG: GatB/YqeY domain-containing protein [Parvularculales bacterium]
MIRDCVVKALRSAVKVQDRQRMSTLRLMMAAIKDRDITLRSNGTSDGVSDSELLDVFGCMVKQRREAVSVYEEAGRPDLAEREQAEVSVISEFLPLQLEGDEMRTACEQIVMELGATSLKDMGRVMGALKKRYAGQIDFTVANTIVRSQLGEVVSS